TVQRSDLLTFGVVLAFYFASNGVEALRTALNRAYRVAETRSILFRRLQSLFFVLVATIGFLVVTVLLVPAPIIIARLETHFDWIKPYTGTITFWRLAVASIVIILALFSVHKWLPDGDRSIRAMLPGIVFTLVAWLVGSLAFAAYLDSFAS